MPAILYTSGSWQRHPVCFINEGACTTEGGVEKLAHTPLAVHDHSVH